jgi:ABC-type Fe2+-enterobactin transport system substrate-binding protein
MNTQKSVYNKLFKEETKLASHEVELASIKDLQEVTKILQGAESSADKVANAFEQKVAEANKAYTALMNERNAIYKYINNEGPARLSDFEKAAKQLGLEINNVPEVVALRKEIQNGKELVKALDGYKKPNDVF